MVKGKGLMVVMPFEALLRLSRHYEAGAITETQYQIRVDTVRDLTLINLMVLHDKFDFGGKRIKKFHQELANLSDCLTKGLVKIEEIAEILDVECGVKL